MKICALKNNYHKLYKYYIYYLHFMQDIEEKKNHVSYHSIFRSHYLAADWAHITHEHQVFNANIFEPPFFAKNCKKKKRSRVISLTLKEKKYRVPFLGVLILFFPPPLYWKFVERSEHEKKNMHFEKKIFPHEKYDWNYYNLFIIYPSFENKN